MRLGILALSLLFVTAGQAPQDDAKKEMDKLQGNWAVTSMNGQDVPSEAGVFLTFKGDKYEQWVNGNAEERGSIKIDTKTRPFSIDLVITEGNDAGKTQPGVYELNGDTLSIGLATAGDTARPATVAQGELQAVLKKVK